MVFINCIMQVNGLKDRAQDLRKSFIDSLEEDIRDFLINEAELHTYDDLTKVNPVTPSTVLKCLQARYSAKVFYTHAGCTLVALNPFQPIPDLYSLDVMREYHSAPQPQEFKPHIFIVAEEAYRNVQGQVEPMNQSLVYSGESGAGKTWTSRCLMKYYATVAASSQKCQDTVEKIERRVLGSNPIMEAFGNACTLRNSNSSRFGKYIQLQLNGSQLLVGASVQTFLLEKTRVAFQAPNERNFHIFYQMMKGATGKQRLEWMLPLDQDFAWLPHAEKTLEGKYCTSRMCLLKHEKRNLRRHLACVDYCSLSLFMLCAGFLQKTADLLQVPLDELQSCLTVRTLRAGKQNVLKLCSQSECSVRRDCLAKVIYAQLFDWLVTFINNSMCADRSMWCNFIGLLDVYGFECFLLNNLEQLCINYANEKLQQHFVAHYLKAQQEEYVTEGLQWSFIRYQDNQGCLDLIEGSPSSIFSLLNEECRLNRASDAKQFCVRLQKELSHNASISWDKFSKQPHFTVAHYADKVSYQIEGMMEKNKDPVPPELISLLQNSQDSLLHSLFADGDHESEGLRGHSKVVTVISKFRNSLESLMKILHSTTPHYTRCIKPNPDCRPLTFKREEVITQLEACGIVETINISARCTDCNFFGLFQLFCKCGLPIPIFDVLNVVLKRRASNSTLSPDDNNNMVHCGRTKVFLTHSLLEMLEVHRNRVRSQKAFCIQCCWRRYQNRQRNLKRQAATRLQAGVRSWLVRREIRKWHKAASVIQTKWRRWRVWMDALAEAELDDAEDFIENEASSALPKLDRLLKERGSVQLSSIQEPVMVRGWPIGLAMASPPSITVSLTATGFQRIMSMMACLKIPFRNGEYKVKTNQFDQGVASIRAQPRGSIKVHLQRSPLLYADMHPVHKTDVVTGFNQILLERP
uniref:Unconventional myosin-XIX-like n=1 Tax=Sinocyclocheilus anshuiensis TaxID=1608454 RepID=A0A671L3P0_9TELE